MKETKVLKRLFQDEIIKINARSGKMTILHAMHVFARVSNLKKIRANRSQKATPEMQVEVYELMSDATFKQMAAQFCKAPNKPEEICLTESQIVRFCRNYKQYIHTTWATFFVFKHRKWWQRNTRYFVAFVSVSSDGLQVDFYRFGDAPVWSAVCHPRLVVPQLGN